MAASCGNGERSRVGGDSRPPVRSGGSAPRRGAAAACPHRGVDRESLIPVPAANSIMARKRELKMPNLPHLRGGKREQCQGWEELNYVTVDNLSIFTL
ncbi:hypothetical protein PVAP13_1KG321600 [Panicum virgatum]|uniref:Uncharacterized protein n=1 Tax=Panicum virgatum TaxID=38727 RepID=A0A8T0XGJ6_PANVG|nr:hypothetical protein PVAP13_1KG321600 [Panicum virgatum]